ncbi:zinc metallopeptidase [Anatilimnocola sp. NA78]|uniref:zinc metallopeptidase n=1 Tax=Anatilimnocola sp. NA78 TaxID=3415683 RepID=UPI003CE50E57
MFGFTQIELLLWTLPAIGLAFLAQMWVSSAYAKGQQFSTGMTGFAAARHILDGAGLHQVQIEPVPGHMSDHYDPRDKVLRLSSDVFHGRTLTAVGIAAHEAGHAIQDAVGYVPLVIRNIAVPVAGFGSNAGAMLMLLGVIFSFPLLLLAGIVLFSGMVFFQLINLPVEFNASTRAKRLLVSEGVVHPNDMGPVNNVLNAAALTYVAGTLQSVLTLAYYIMRYSGGERSRG